MLLEALFIGSIQVIGSCVVNTPTYTNRLEYVNKKSCTRMFPGKRQPSEWEKIIANKATDRELISKIYKQLMQLNSRKINEPIKKMGQRTKQTFLQRRHTDG